MQLSNINLTNFAQQKTFKCLKAGWIKCHENIVGWGVYGRAFARTTIKFNLGFAGDTFNTALYQQPFRCKFCLLIKSR